MNLLHEVKRVLQETSGWSRRTEEAFLSLHCCSKGIIYHPDDHWVF